MRLVFAKIFFSFDLELVDKELEWLEGQKVLTLWDKPELMVRITPIERLGKGV
jgi:hypothetical protein